MRIFDTHCDTVYELVKNGQSFDNNIRHISEDRIKKYDVYRQVFALWSDHKRTEEENWQDFFVLKECYDKEILSRKSEHFIPHLAIEGGSLLAGKTERIDILKECGVKLLTLVWKDECCMGGAHNTNKGLSDFGRNAVKKLFEVGIIPDLSHASDKMIYETLEMAHDNGKPVMASHSNSRTVREHTRNLTDELFCMIKQSGGIVGISLCCNHLDCCDSKNANITSVIRHIEHYMSLEGENTVTLGCDFDGTSPLPDGIEGADDIYKIADELQKINYSDELIDNIMFKNAMTFFERHVG